MGSVHQVTFGSKRDELSVAEANLTRALRQVVEAKVGKGATFDDLEATTLEVTNETGRSYLEQVLQELSDSYDKELLIDGVHYKQSHQQSLVHYHSLLGPLHVERATYRQAGQRGGLTLVPLELEAGIVEGATPALGYSIALGYAQQPSRHYVEQMKGAYRNVPSRATVERIGKAIGAKAKEAAPRIESYLRRSEELPEEVVAIAIGLDRTSVPYEEPREAEKKQDDGESRRSERLPKRRRYKRKKRTKPYVRRAPERIDVQYRMDYVGTVSLIDQDGEAVVTWRYAATHKEGPDGILKRMMGDVRAVKRRKLELPVGILQDGAKELWLRLTEALEREPSVTEWLEGIDRYHMNERLGEILKETEANPERREELSEEWQKRFTEDDATVDELRSYLENQLEHGEHDANAFNVLLGNLTYIENNGHRMRYVSLREAGLPVGSGPTEGACKSLVSSRAKRSGQRWHDDGISAVLTLRAIHQSDRLPPFWKHLHRRYVAHVQPLDMAA